MPVTIWAPETLVNTITAGEQSRPSVAVLKDGTYVVVWESFNETPEAPGFDSWDVKGQRYAADGTALGGEFTVSSDLEGSQTNPTVVALANGGFTVAWTDAGQVENRIFNAAGVPQGDDAINGGGSAISGLASAAAGGGAGRVEVVEYQNDIHLLRYDSSGAFTGNILFNTTTAGTQESPDVAELRDGKHVVVWATDGEGVRARWIHANGVLVGSDFAVNTTPVGASTDYKPKVTALEDGGFVVVWKQSGSAYPGHWDDIRGRVFDSFGNPVGADFLVNQPTSFDQDYPEVVALADGGFIALWWHDSDFTLRGQRFDVVGERVGSSFVVSTEGGASPMEDGISAALTADGRVVVTWRALTDNDEDSEDHAVHSTILDPREGWVEGGSTWDTLYGGGGADQILGLGGFDQLFGLAGDDTVYAGAGSDSLYGGENEDALHGQGGTDRLFGETGEDSLYGGAGADTLDGGASADVLHGGGGDDRLIGGAGGDTLDGGAGFDVADYLSAPTAVKLNLTTGAHTGVALGDVFIGVDSFLLTNGHDGFVGGGEADSASGEDGNDKLEGGAGADTLLGGDGQDTLLGGDDGDLLHGGTLKDTLFGEAGADILDGHDGDDVLDGGTEADTLIGGLGRDLLTGGAGADRFVWFDKAESGTTGPTRDQVKDYNRAEGDILDLSDIDAADGGPGDVTDDAFTFVAAFTGVAGQLRAVTGGGGTFSLVQGDVDGDGVADFVIQVYGSAPLTAADFIL